MDNALARAVKSPGEARAQLAVASAVRMISEREAAWPVNLLSKTALDLGLKGVTVDMIEKMHGPLDEQTADALYAHCARFGTSLQVPAEMWPQDRAAFAEYWEEGLKEVHIDPDVRDFLLRLTTLQNFPRRMRRLAPFNVFVTTGFLPQEFREQMGLPWNDEMQARFDKLMRRLGRIERALPTQARIFPFNVLLMDMRRRLRTGKALV